MNSNATVPNLAHYRGSQSSNSLVAKLSDLKKDITDFNTMSSKTRILEKIESSTLKHGTKIAIDAESTRLSYREYYDISKKLSTTLKSLHLGAEDKVVVFLDPSEHIPIALLAIFMTGAVYVPIDTSWPQSRIDAILDDVQPKAILTQTNNYQRFTHLEDVEVIDMNKPHYNSAYSQAQKTTQPNLSNTAVIFYTSGSTGMPKGVELSYRNIESFVESAFETYRFKSSDVHLSIAKYSFSISLFDFLLPFYSGGALKLKTRENYSTQIH